ncbi:hypothetical protein NIES4074_43720 [Cylindrospermum sp. NIES-4074]|nr:hypothetical protein NIES4074_43720 [Cylindrospermum sp. NIES-4074]
MVYRNVEIIDSAGNPIGEFDKIEDGVLIEEKSAIDISKLNPRTGKPFQTTDDWAARQIFVKTDIRIQNLEKAVNTKPTSQFL